MRIKIYVILSVTFLLICSCNSKSDIIEKPSEGTVPLRFTATVGEMQLSRVGTQDDKIELGQRVWMWIDNADDGTKHIGAWQHASDGAYKLNPIPYITKYFPAGNRPVDIYAVHGNFFVTADTNKPDTIAHSVYTNQISSSNYLVSDLLWVADLNHQAKDSIKLKFRHMLSKIEICFKPEGMITDAMLVGATAKLLDMQKDVKLCLVDGGGVTYGSATDIDIPFNTIPAASTSWSSATYGEVVVPPQKITNRNLIQVDLADGKQLYYRPDSAFTFEAGKVYRFNMLVKPSIQLPPRPGDDWEYEDENTKFRLEPEYLIPRVSDWNYDDKYMKWTYRNLPERVGEWAIDNLDKHAYKWDSIQIATGQQINHEW